MEHKTRLLTLVLGCAAVGGAQAQLYRWVDENGKVQYGDQIPTKYNDGASSQLNGQGVTTKKTDASLSAAQRQAQEAEKLRQAEADKANKEQERKDKALLSAYSKKEDIDRAERRQLELIEQNIVVTESRIKELNTRINDLQQKLKSNNKQLALEKEHTMLSAELPALTKRVVQWQQEMQTIKQRFENERSRFVLLTTPASAKSGQR
ncbi:MAG: hypothetical protein RLZZ502_645 [Pseudomonadota bacterium]|jgi:DNA repair exonuclease SbcCD ATPase subunit